MSKRKVILFSGSLGVVLAAMTLYLLANGESPRREERKEPFPTSLPEERAVLTHVAGRDVGPGQDLNVPLVQGYTEKLPNGQTVRKERMIGKLVAQGSAIPTSGRFHLIKPRFWNYLKDGRVIYIESDSGDFEAAEAAKNSLNAKSGTLNGNVVIIFDLSTEPNRGPPRDRPDDTIRIYTERLSVDYTENLIQTDLQLRVESRQAGVLARGLELRLDPVNRAVTDLKLNTEWAALEGRAPFIGEMLIRQGLDLTNGGLPSGRSKAPKAAAAPGGAATPAEPAKPKPPPDPSKVQTYLATFNQDVEVLQGFRENKPGEKNREPQHGYRAMKPEEYDGLLASDRTVSAIFDFASSGAKEKAPTTAPEAGKPARPAGSAAAKPAVPTAGPAAGPVAGAAAPPADKTQTVRIAWRGVLTMVPMDAASRGDRIVTGQRRELIAEGENVVLRENDGKAATCRKLNYDTETRIARLFGTVTRPAVLVQPDGTRIECESLVYDQANEKATMVGGGTLLARGEAAGGLAVEVPSAGAPTSQPRRTKRATTQPGTLTADEPDAVVIQWDRRMDVLFAAGAAGADRAKAAPTTQPSLLGRERMREANIQGNVRLRQGDNYHVNAENVIARFMAPSDAVKPNQLETVQAIGRLGPDKKFAEQVRIVSKGRPARATATQPDSILRGASGPGGITCDWLTVTMQVTPERTTAQDKVLAIGHVAAVQADSTISGERMELQYARREPAPGDPPGKKASYEPQEVQVFRNVTVINPQQRLTAAGDHLYSLVGSDKATLTGLPARVQLDDKKLDGPIIEIDQKKQAVAVQGKGHMQFPSQRDLNGNNLAEPAMMNATWAMGMSYDTAADLADLRGEVTATSGRSQIKADLLLLYMEEKPKAPNATTGPDATTAPDGGLSKAPRRRRPTTGPASGPDTAPDNPLMNEAANKQIKKLIAERNVEAQSSNVDPANNHLLTRVWISAAKQLIFDNATGQLDVNGPGRLLLEDYRPPDQNPKPRPGAVISTDAPQPRAIRPSQTQFAWRDAMHFNSQDLLGTFESDVRMAHRGPDVLALEPDGSVRKKGKDALTVLSSDKLFVQFQAAANKAKKPAGAAGGATLLGPSNSIDDVKEVRALGGPDYDVLLADPERSVSGRILEYLKPTDTVNIEGDEANDAEIFRVAPDGTHYDEVRAKRIVWNRATGKIEWTDSRYLGGSAPPAKKIVPK